MRDVRTPVALLIFNRPECTRIVFERVAAAKPKKLLVVADGPRSQEEERKCLAARAITDQVTWDCEVLRNYSDVNLGCGRRVASGLDWVFEKCAEAIILEDDCVPDPCFFPYCDELLQRYRGEPKVMSVCGTGGDLFGIQSTNTYEFSRYSFVWGWGTWRRAWQTYDFRMARWRELRNSRWLEDLLQSEEAAAYWRYTFDRSAAGEIDTWDYMWLFNCWLQRGLAAVPSVNLVSNIGFGPEASHTKDMSGRFARMPVSQLPHGLKHPLQVTCDLERDAAIFKAVYKPAGSHNRPGVLSRLRAWLGPAFSRSLLGPQN